MNLSNLFNLNLKDVTKAIVVAVIVGFLGGLQQMFSQHGLDLASFDWSFILNLAVTSGVGYLGKNFLSDSDGKVMGRIG